MSEKPRPRQVRALRDVATHSPVLVKGKLYAVEYERGDEVAVRAEGWRLVWVKPGVEVEIVEPEAPKS